MGHQGIGGNADRGRVRPHHRARSWAATVGLLVTAVLGLAVPAQAATEACTPSSDTGCLSGTIRTADGAPATGVSLEVVGPSETTTVVTSSDGRWSLTLTEPGEYTVTLDVATLPDGETLRDPGANPRTVSVTLGASAAALFPLGTPTATAAPPAEGGEATAAPGSEPGLGDGSSTTTGRVTWGRVGQQLASGLIFGILLALASVGLSLIFGTTGLSNFAHGEQVTLGGIMAYVFTQVAEFPLVLSAVLAVLVGAASGWLQDAGIWRPLRRMRVGMTQQLIVTIGLAIALQYTFQFLLGGNSLRIVRANPSLLHLGPIAVGRQSVISLFIALVVLSGVGYMLTRTRIGRATRAVSDNSALAAASGIAVDGIVRLVWTLGAGLAALGGVLMGLYLNATAWNMGSTLLLLMFASVTLGGLGTAFGAFVGSIVIGLVVELSALVIPIDMRYAGALVILILVLLVRPQGILGRAERIG